MINSQVWLKNNEDWIAGIYIGKVEEKFKVMMNNKIFLFDQIENKNDDDIDNVDNLINIPHLNEPSILNCISIRYKKNEIYTYTGKILISVNPFKNFGLYEKDIIENYKNKKLKKPHLYEVCNSAFENILNKKANQSILVSGESGAGKTHSTKVIMQYLAHISGKGEDIKNKIINSNPILEAFGNAKTIFNDNSSRFGKYIKLKFDENNKLIGASIESYLLEKIRLIHQNENERNFHIFYQIIHGMSSENKEKYKLYDINYLYLKNNLLKREDGVNDNEEYNILLNAFKLLDFKESEVEDILCVTIGILKLGSITFNEKGDIVNKNLLQEVSELLKIESSLLEKTLCFRKLNVNQEIYEIKLEKNEATTIRDSLAMKIYEKLFNYIVSCINRSIDKEYKVFIGILDIFGFESFKHNSFEQLCINYTNENLQNQFNKYIFKLEQEEYKREGIDWKNIDYPDNKNILNLIDNKKSILSLLDEECKLPKGNDTNYNSKLIKSFSSNINFIVDKKYINEKFGIKHYAGDVIYNSKGFCEKNKDKVSKEVNLCLSSTLYDFINQNNYDNESNIKAKSLSYKFRKQLKDLILVIDKTDTHYIRCLKPNNKNLPDFFNRKKVIEQLKYCGVIEAIKVSRSGYAVRMLHDKFKSKYKVINDFKNLNEISIFKEANYQVGLTKIFLKTEAYEKIEDLRLKYLNFYAISIQKNVRMLLKRNKFNFIKNTVLTLQSFYKIILAKKLLVHLRENKKALIIQSKYRSYVNRKSYLTFLKKANLIKNFYLRYRGRKIYVAAKKIQLLANNFLKRKKRKLILLNKSSIIIQKNIRCYLTFRTYADTLNKIILIQNRVKRFLNNKNKLIKKNKELSNKLKETESKVKELEEINEIKVVKLTSDIDAYKECITKNMDEKVNMWNEIEKLRLENKLMKEKMQKQKNKKSFWDWNLFGR